MTDRVLCRYFALNACKKGDACPFSHNLKDQPSNVCTFYLRGNCTYGTNCRYEHVSARKLAETQGWGPLAGKPGAGGYSAPESSPPSVLISAHSPTAISLGGTQVESPIPTRPVSADKGGVNRDGVDANGSKSWAAMAAKTRKESGGELSKAGGKGEDAPKGPVSGGKSLAKGVENGHAVGQQGPNSGLGIARSTSGAESDASESASGGVSSHTATETPSLVSSESDLPGQTSNSGMSNGTAQASEQAGNAKESSGEEFDVQRGAWRPPHLQGASEGGKVSPGIPHSISPGLNSAARAFSPSSAYQDPNGGQYMPAAGYPPHMGGALMVPPYGLTDENGIPYEDNGLPDELWDWVDQMTISDQDEYAAINGYEMQGIAYVPGQPYPQSFSPSPPIAYVPGQLYPQTYSPAPYQQYAQPYPEGANPYLQTPQVYHANPFPAAPQNPPEPNSEHPQNSETAETPETSGLMRNNSLDDFPHLASPNPNPSETENANPNLSPKDQPICPFAAAGDCPREKDGGSCGQLHGDKCPSCGKRCLHPHRPEETKEHLEGCEKRVKKLKQLQKSQEVECCVCLERVLSKPRVAERKFGILSGCDHAFCIGCIRGWRSGDHTTPGMDLNAVVRSCPVCRQQSYFVTPSVVWYSSPEEKDQILEGYKRKLKAIDCRHFNFGDGSCPFGTSCFYRHRFRDGREEEVTLRHLGTADGTVTIAKSVRLSDFIDLSALQKRR